VPNGHSSEIIEQLGIENAELQKRVDNIDELSEDLAKLTRVVKESLELLNDRIMYLDRRVGELERNMGKTRITREGR
jgi:flagellar motility protein MotE (MotC chaperone)